MTTWLLHYLHNNPDLSYKVAKVVQFIVLAYSRTRTHAHAPIRTYALLLIICLELSKQPLEKQREILVLRKSFVRRKKGSRKTYELKPIIQTLLEASRCSLAKQQQRNVQESVLLVQSWFFLIRTITFFFRRSLCRRHLALHDFIFCVCKLSILMKAFFLALAKSIYQSFSLF